MQMDDREWIELKRKKAVNFAIRGYSVEWRPNADQWITAYTPGDSLNAQARLEAAAKFYPEPSKYGIDEGCISKLCIRLIDETLGNKPNRITTLFNYDRGLDIDILERHKEARELYDAMLFELNSHESA